MGTRDHTGSRGSVRHHVRLVRRIKAVRPRPEGDSIAQNPKRGAGEDRLIPDSSDSVNDHPRFEWDRPRKRR